MIVDSSSIDSLLISGTAGGARMSCAFGGGDFMKATMAKLIATTQQSIINKPRAGLDGSMMPPKGVGRDVSGILPNGLVAKKATGYSGASFPQAWHCTNVFECLCF
jgi:hypothetical protein